MPVRSPNSPDKVLAKLGRAIAKARDERGFTQEELALESEIDRSYIGSIERGNQNIGVLHLSKIAHALKMTVAELVSKAGV